MSQKNCLNTTMADTQFADVARTCITRVKHKQALARNDDGTGPHAAFVRHG